MKKLSIVMPAYNEEKRIGRTLEFYSKFFEEKRKTEKFEYEILVVINNTTDKTEEIVKEYSKQNKRIVYLNLIKGGKGYAIIEGFKDALKRNNELIGFVDADMATLPEDFYNLAVNIGSFDGIIASRYIKGASITPRPTLARLIAKRTFNSLVKSVLLLPFNDTQCGAKIFRRDIIEKVIPSLWLSKWAFDVDFLFSAKKHGFKIKEFPTNWRDKKYSKINFWQAGPWMALAVIRLRMLNSPFKFGVRIYDNFLKLLGNKE